MPTKKKLLPLAVFMISALCAEAKIWRVNNNAGVTADFATLAAAVSAASVVNGDTLHIEPSATNYGSATLTKRLIIIGAGYLLNPLAGGNAGLQANTNASQLNGLTINNGANGSKFMGIQFTGSNGIGASAVAWDLVFESCIIQAMYFAAGNHDGLALRKCYCTSGFSITGGSLSNCVIENCLFIFPGNPINLSNFSTTGCIVRNNVFKVIVNTSNAYFANNIVVSPSGATLTNCNVKNNLFTFASQTLPGGAIGNQLGMAESMCLHLPAAMMESTSLKRVLQLSLPV
ncbi:hypothetical protein [Paraflavitalea speifideaquila]|uniref:hypothetical protein n=1 Tax=Paraflavitalea speifideaquila TaxID=3076558 RepID=UPI0028ED5E9C|nr:hypothetical protein [Paraflavitalea speifideiaquila]